MQMNIETDYAIRCMLYMGGHEGYSPSALISREMVIPKEQIQKILRKLMDAGLVISQRGQDGGYKPSRPVHDIKVLDVISCMEETIKINRCLEKDGFCNRKATISCPMHKYYYGVQNILEQVFQNTSIKDILDGKATGFSSLG